MSRRRGGAQGGEPSGNGEVPSFPCPYGCGAVFSTLALLAIHGNVCPNRPGAEDDPPDDDDE